MRESRVSLLLSAVVILPAVVMTWGGLRLLRQDTAVAEQRTRVLLEDRLRTVDGQLRGFVAERELEILRLLSSISPEMSRNPAAAEMKGAVSQSEAIRRFGRSPLLNAVFVLDSEGELIFPDPGDPGLAASDRDFLERTRWLREEGSLLFTPTEMESHSSPARQGWRTWLWHDGLCAIYRLQAADGTIVGVELNRARLLADIIAALPDAGGVERGREFRITLLDSRKHPLYQWGNYEHETDPEPKASIPASPPFETWRWTLHMPESVLPRVSGVRKSVQVASAVVSVVLALILMLWIVRREVRGKLQEASVRVSFVNRVSHELKTPLTNICMYAEMLEDAMADGDAVERRYAAVIARESRRLGRLISNVLTFSRQQRDTVTLRPEILHLNELVSRITEECAPELSKAGLKTVLDLRYDGPVYADPDALSQIVFNLLSNARKYAKGSGDVVISTRLAGQSAVLRISDAGPGIPEEYREQIFEPFFRVSDRTTDGVSGTGIGLSIARDLARLHGGDLVLGAGTAGAVFDVLLPIQKSED